jgi:hypothetical protein
MSKVCGPTAILSYLRQKRGEELYVEVREVGEEVQGVGEAIEGHEEAEYGDQ